MNMDKIFKKIEGLIAKGESTEFEEERDALIGKATELMAKHRITRDDLGMDDADVVTIDVDPDLLPNTYKKVYAYGLTQIAQPMGVYGYINFVPYPENKVTSIVLIGDKEAIDNVVNLFKLLIMDCVNQTLQFRPAVPHTGRLRVDRKNFVSGYWAGVADKITATLTTMDESSESDGLLPILLSDYEKAAAEAPDNLTTEGVGTNAAGYEAGQAADIGQKSVTPSRKAIAA